MMATDELELAFLGTDAPAFDDGPSLRRILVAVRAPGEAAEALAVTARVCRTIGGVLRLGARARLRSARAPRGPVLPGDGQRRSGRARQGTAGRLGLRRPAGNHSRGGRRTPRSSLGYRLARVLVAR
jgi:hypothetical protein